jgi:hypothetical protein
MSVDAVVVYKLPFSVIQALVVCSYRDVYIGRTVMIPKAMPAPPDSAVVSHASSKHKTSKNTRLKVRYPVFVGRVLCVLARQHRCRQRIAGTRSQHGGGHRRHERVGRSCLAPCPQRRWSSRAVRTTSHRRQADAQITQSQHATMRYAMARGERSADNSRNSIPTRSQRSSDRSRGSSGAAPSSIRASSAGGRRGERLKGSDSVPASRSANTLSAAQGRNRLL